ncbi:MAG: PqqD family protein [Desulfovibrio sp.]|nr:PqqD family protein [Desulfovibrio sp.]
MSSYVLNEAKMFSDIADGIAIVINSETGIYYGMNGLGTQVFGSLMDDASAEAVLTALKALPDAPEDMEARFNSFVDALKDFEIILEGGDGTGAVNIDADTAKTDEFTLTLQEFNDAQELLLADPIHEVKDDTGWQPDMDSLETDQDVVAAKEAKIQK